MITSEQRSEIRRLFYVSHFSANAIALALGVHRDTVLRALEVRKAERDEAASELDRFTTKIKETLELYPKLHGSRIHMMLREQGYTGSVRHLRRKLQTLRQPFKERFYVKCEFLPGECAQVDWGHFGTLKVGKAERKLSAFVMTLAWSRRMFVYFTFDQKIETLLDCHRRAFLTLGGVPRTILYDNMKTVVVERLGSSIRYHDALIEFREHWLFQPSVCAPYQPQSKGRVERSIRYFRGSFFEARAISDIGTLNIEAQAWCESESEIRNWPEDPSKKVSDAFIEEKKVLLPLPEIIPGLPRKHLLKADRYGYVHFDRNLYSVPANAASLQLTLWIYENEISIASGKDEIVRHPRSYDAGERIEKKEHRDEINSYKSKPRISQSIARLSEALPGLESLMRQWIEFNLDTKALVNFLTKANDLHGSTLIQKVVQKSFENRVSRIEDVGRLLYEFLQEYEPAPPINLRLPDRTEVRDLFIKSHDLDTYDDL
jgi:transposase